MSNKKDWFDDHMEIEIVGFDNKEKKNLKKKIIKDIKKIIIKKGI